MKNPMENNVLTKILDIVATVVLIFSICVCSLVIVSMKSSTGLAQLFGYSFLSVQSDSMEPVFYEGDLIMIERTDEDADRLYKVGDIVTFVAFDDYGTRFLNTHRIAEAEKGEKRNRYVTKGDNSKEEDTKTLFNSSILGIYSGKRVSKLGTVLDYLNSANGVLFCVVIPAAIIIAWQISTYVNAYIKRKRQILDNMASRAQAQQTAMPFVPYYPPGTVMGGYVPTGPISVEDAEKEQIIQEFLAKQRDEEAKKQAVIEEYLAKQKAAEEAAKADAEAEKIKAIISEFLAQQAAAGQNTQTADSTNENNPPEKAEEENISDNGETESK